MKSSYDRAYAKQALAQFRSNRRSATTDRAAGLCRSVGYEIDKKRQGLTLARQTPWGAADHDSDRNKVLGLKTATGILTILEEVFDRDGANEQHG